jgi:uncharacterized OB-fold protein
MDNLPNELNYEISNYLYTCRKNTNYIINKEYYKIYKHKTKKCKKIYLLRKHLCEECDKKNIWRARMILNNLLPG